MALSGLARFGRTPKPSFGAALAGAVVLATLSGHEAVAQTSDPCLSAPIDGQQAQRAGKLLEARASYLACSSGACPKVIVSDCEHWLREVDDALPSVILAARDAAGNDVLDARVSIDGAAPVQMTALGVPLNPGEHKFTFHRAGAPDVEQQALLRAGEKNRQIVATFGGGPGGAVVPIVTERPVPVATWIVAGTGIVALGFFGTFGALGVSQRSSDGCGGPPGCSTSDRTSVNTKFDVADIGLATGVVALGAAAWIYFARPSIKVEARAPAPAAFFDFRPAAGGGVGVVGGRF